MAILQCTVQAEANPGANLRTKQSAFRVPPILRARVNFWKDIFAKYGRQQVVFHHRDFPQITFGVMDFSRAAAELGPIQLDAYKKKVVAEHTEVLKAALRNLATGAAPADETEQMLARQMKNLPGGRSKYQKMLDEELLRTQTGIKEKFADAVRRSGRYLPLMEKIFVEGYGLPVELTRLPFVESSFDYTAYSSVGAAGIWQFMPSTGKLYMTVNKLVDERRDPVESSKAAAQYLKDAYNRLGSWPLAITSYNHGVAGVSRKVKKMGTSDLSKLIENHRERVFGFASSNFYPEFLAAVEVYNDYKTYFPGIELEPALQPAQVRISKAASVQSVSRQLGVDLDVLRTYNYALSEKIWDGKSKIPAGYDMKVPAKAGIQVASLMPSPEETTAEPDTSSSAVHDGIVYRVRKGDTLLSIARKYRVTVAQLMEANRLKRVNLKVGQNLVITQNLKTDGTGAKEETRPPAKKIVAPKKNEKPKLAAKQKPAQAKRVVHKIRKGESLYAISRRYGTTVQAIKNLNGLKSTNLTPGRSLIVK